MGYFDRFRETGHTAQRDQPLPPPTPQTAVGEGLAWLAGGADRITVVDCETTGVYNSDRIVELAIVTLDLDGQVVDSWETLIDPRRDVGASHIHGLTAHSLRGAPTFADVAGDVAIRLHGACLAAHNLPFDTRMLCNEFARLGSDLTVVAGIDTLTATRCRLAVACELHRISLYAAHSALADATATAELLICVAAGCSPGAPAAAPTGLLRAARVLRRIDTAPVAIADPPHVARLIATLDHAGLEANMLSYLELVARALADLHLDADERRQLAELAAGLGLNAAHLAQAHRRFVNDLIDAALADDVVTGDELDMLLRIATALDVDTEAVEHRTRPALAAALAVELRSGMSVTFTGDDPFRTRAALIAHANDLGMSVGGNVTKATDLLVAYDTSSTSGKAGKARSYNVPIISTAQFATAQTGERLDAEGSAVEARKVITCPDCHATWTVPARSGAQSSRRCDDCSTVERPPATPRLPRPPSPTAIEDLTCSVCGRSWVRERVRGRKPHRCPDCAE